MLTGFNEIVVDEFRGLITLPDFRDVSALWSPGPCENIAFIPGGFMLRPGAIEHFDLGAGSVLHGERFVRSDTEARYFLWLMGGAIYSSQEGARTLLHTPNASTSIFRVVPYGNRAYILMSNGKAGLEEPRIWDTTNLDPMTVEGQAAHMMAAADGATGSVTAGEKRLSIVYETRAGFRIPACASGTLTSTGVVPADGDTVTIPIVQVTDEGKLVLSGQAYRFKNVLAAAFDVLIAGTASGTLDNLKAAVNLTGVAGTDYGTGTTVHPTCRGRAKTATTLIVEANLASLVPELLPVAESSAQLSWGSTTLLNYTLYTAPGSAKISVTAIPNHTNPSVVKKHITMTESGLLSKHIALTIEDNTTTAGTIDIADAQLVNQTNVDNDSQNMQPAANGMAGVMYNERLVMVDGSSRVRVSEPLFPHTFRADVGYLEVGVNDGESTRAVAVVNGVLYIFKNYRTYYTEDNGADPVEWSVREHSQRLGTPSPAGVDSNEADQWTAILGHNALSILSGSAIYELSRNIRPTWQAEILAGPERSKVIVDATAKRIFCILPNGASGETCDTYVCDYTEGLKPDQVKWSKWVTGQANWQGVLIDNTGASVVATLVYSLSSKVRRFSSTIHYDDAALINTWKYRLGRIGGRAGVTSFEEIEMKCAGGGNLVIETFGPDGISLGVLSNIALAATPGKNYTKPINVVRENMYLELRQTTPTAMFTMNHLTVFARPDGYR